MKPFTKTIAASIFTLIASALVSTAAVASPPMPTVDDVEAARIETITPCGIHEATMRTGLSPEDSLYVLDCYQARLNYYKSYQQRKQSEREQRGVSQSEK